LVYRRTIEFPTGPASFMTSLTPIVHGAAGTTHVLGLTRDVTNETNLIENAELHSALLQRLGVALPSAIYLLDTETKSLRYVGGEGSDRQRAWRTEAMAVSGEGAQPFFHPDDWPRVQAHWDELATLADGEVTTISYRLAAHGGEYRRHIHREVVLSRDNDGKVKLVLGVSEDVSDHDRVEQEARDLSAQIVTLQIDERRRIAQELHDSTGQHLTAAGLALGNARKLQGGAPIGEPDVSLRAAIDDAAQCLREAQREIRVLSYLLHPPHLRSHCLAEALEDFTTGFAMRAGLKIKVQIAPEASTIHDDVAVHLFRVCQEALTNVYRHANAKKAQVTLEVDGAIRLTVKDDGIGFDASAADRVLSVGLPGMRDRMARLGGAVEIYGDPGGTTLIATLPLDRAQAQDGGARTAA
jgi:signal transduction histidine kinase